MKNTIRNILLGASLIVLANPSFATRHEALTDDAPCRVPTLQQQAVAKIFTKDIHDEKAQDLIKQRIYRFSENSLFHLLYHHKINEAINMTDNGYERLLFLQNINNLPPEKWRSAKNSIVSFLKLFKDIIPTSRPGYLCDRDTSYIYGRSKIFHKLLALRSEEHRQTTLASSILLKGAKNGQDLPEIVNIIMTQPFAERLNFAKMCEPLIKGYTQGCLRKEIIKNISALPQESREKFIQNYLRLTPQKKKDHLHYNVSIMSYLASIPESERDLFVEQSLSVYKGIYEQYSHIKIMSSLSFEDRIVYSDIIKSFSKLVRQNDIVFFF